MALDSKGRLYVATASGIQVIDPRGEYLGTIRVPASTAPGAPVKNVAFGGRRRQTLYMTGNGGLYRVQMLSEGPSGRAK